VRDRFAILDGEFLVIADDHQLRARRTGRQPERDEDAERALPRLPHFPLRLFIGADAATISAARQAAGT
jgi:hypothetical protein